jgi:hypothetical protein
MGWWWSTGTPSATASPTSHESSVKDNLPADNFPEAPPSVQAAEAPSPALTREEQVNEEWVSWLKEIDAENQRANNPKSKSKSSPASSAPPPPEDISPDSLYPTEISCQSAFDYAFFCQSFGGQFVNIYRYGGFRSCSNHWEDFWQCMRTRNWAEKDRKLAIQDHYRKRAVKYKTGPSSEDVWEVRTDPAVDAFQGNLEALERKIEEWKRENPDATAPWEKAI